MSQSPKNFYSGGGGSGQCGFTFTQDSYTESTSFLKLDLFSGIRKVGKVHELLYFAQCRHGAEHIVLGRSNCHEFWG